MSIAEYLYVDRDRLEHYVEQFRSPVQHEKVPVWGVGIGPLPSVKGTQARSARPLTRHEKIVALEEELRKRNLLASRPDVGHLDFVLERCRAYKVVGSEEDASATPHQFILWLSHTPRSTLCLASVL